MTSSEQQEISVLISGHVQGVTFRNFAKKHADEIGVRGFVRNLSDGSVEVVAQGEKQNLETFLKRLKKGPYFARIEDIDVSWHDIPQDTFTDFHIKETV